MYCIKCGAEIEDGVKFCPKCGAPQGAGSASSAGSTAQTNSTSAGSTTYAGSAAAKPRMNMYVDDNGQPVRVSEKSWLATLLLEIFLGGLGIHRFYVGKIGTGILWLITAGIFGIGWIVDLVMIACGNFKDKTDAYLKTEEWKNSHRVGAREWSSSWSGSSAADELKKWKDLYDSGAITREEYEAKKREYMNQ